MRAKIHRKSTWPALVLLVAWLVIAGGLTWHKSRASVLPPVWDQMTYVQKAEGVWSSVLNGNRENPLDIEPSVRPPGTVVLTAPFGPLQDVRNFYFRSVFVPVVIMATAIFLVGIGVTGQGWYSALMAMIASSMPMFWQLEFMDTHYTGYFWGMVDTFQASLAGLAMSGLVLAALRYKRRWLIPSFISLALLPLIKPSGFLIGSLIALAWLVLAVGWANSHPRGPLRGWSGLVTTAISIALIFSGALLASLGTKYFSAQNIEFGKSALKDLRGELFSEFTLTGFETLITSTIGLPQLITIALLGISSRARKSISKYESYHNEARWMGTVGILVFLAGMAMTYQATLFRQARYFFPALAISTVLLTPTFIAWSNRCRKAAYSFIAIAPLSLLVFLATPRLNSFAFSVSGYGLFTGSGKDEVKTANHVVDRFGLKHSNAPILFSSSEGSAAAAFEAAFAKRLKGAGFDDGQIQVYRPFNWGSGGLVEIETIYNADLIALGRPFASDEPRTSNRSSPSKKLTYKEEILAWKKWLAMTPSLGSTRSILDTPKILILEVEDRSKLEKQMRAFIQSRSWRPQFMAANGQKEFRKAEIPELVLKGSLTKDPIDFGNSIRIHALSISRSAGNQNIDISVFSEQISKIPNKVYYFFVHELNAKGEIISSHSIPMVPSRLSERPISLREISLKLLPNTVNIGVGVFEPTTGSLPTDWPRANEWMGRRANFNVRSLSLVTDSPNKP